MPRSKCEPYKMHPTGKTSEKSGFLVRTIVRSVFCFLFLFVSGLRPLVPIRRRTTLNKMGPYVSFISGSQPYEAMTRRSR